MLGFLSNSLSDAIFGKKRRKEPVTTHGMTEKILKTRGAIFVDSDGSIKINDCSRKLITSLTSHSRDCNREMRERGCDPTSFGPLTFVRSNTSRSGTQSKNKITKAQRQSKTTADVNPPTPHDTPSSPRSILEDAMQGRVFALAGKTTPVYTIPGSVSFIDLAGNTTVQNSNVWCTDEFNLAASSGATFVQVPNIIGTNFKIYAIQQDSPIWRRSDGSVPSTTVIPGLPKGPPASTARPTSTNDPVPSTSSTKAEPPSTQASLLATQDIDLTQTQIAPGPKSAAASRRGSFDAVDGRRLLFHPQNSADTGDTSPKVKTIAKAKAPVSLTRNFRSPQSTSTFRLGQHSGENWK